MQPYKHEDLINYVIDPKNDEFLRERKLQSLLDDIPYQPLIIFKEDGPPDDESGNSIWMGTDTNNNTHFAYYNGEH